MVGLPNEDFEDIKNTVNFINMHNIQGLKIHSTYVVKNTVLAEMYKNGKYIPLTLENYLESGKMGTGTILKTLRLSPSRK